MSKVRLIKLVVVPFAVLDDGENLQELEVKPLEVPSEEIDGFINGGLAEAMKTLTEAYD